MNTRPKLCPQQSVTLKRKAEERVTHCQGNVQLCPTKSDAYGKKRSHSSPKLKKQKVLDNTGEGIDDLDSWADELEKAIPEWDPQECTELLGSESSETAGKEVDQKIEKLPRESLMDIIILEDEGSESIDDQPGFPSGIRSNTTGSSTGIHGGKDQWWDLCTDIHGGKDQWWPLDNYITVSSKDQWWNLGKDQWWALNIDNYSPVFSSIGDEALIENHISLGDSESWSCNEMMRKRELLEEHQNCASATRTTGCISTAFPYQSRKGLTDQLGSGAARTRFHLYDFDRHSKVAPQPSPDSLGPKQQDVYKNKEVIVID